LANRKSYPLQLCGAARSSTPLECQESPDEAELRPVLPRKWCFMNVLTVVASKTGTEIKAALGSLAAFAYDATNFID
jgi:hypothetical protein